MRKILFVLSFFTYFNTQSQSLPGYISTNRLAAFYSFTGNANNEFSNISNGTINGATLTQDRFGNSNNAYHFNGLNNTIDFSQAPLGSLDSITISMWVRPTSLNQLGMAICYGFDPGFLPANGLQFGVSGTSICSPSTTGNQLSCIHANYNCGSLNYNAIDTSSWIFVVIQRNNGTTRFYINGTITQTITSSVNSPITRFSVGSSTGLRFFNGDVDDIGIWDRNLTTNEILSLYNSQSPVPNFVPNLRLSAWYPFSGNAKNSLLNSYHGTVNQASLTTDRFGNKNSAYEFNGSNFIDFPSAPLTNLDSISISFWIKPSSLNQLGMAICYGYDPGFLPANGIEVGISGGLVNCVSTTGNILSYIHAANNCGTINYQISDTSKWLFLVLQRQNNTTKYYVNGNLSLTINSTINSPITRFSIGSSSGHRFFKGKVDDVGIWNRNLSQQEISNLYNSNCSLAAPNTTNSLTCGSAALQLSATTQGLNQTIDWYSTQSGGTALSGGVGVLNYTTPILTTTTTFYAQSRDTITGCVSSIRTPAVATVYSSLVPSTPLSVYGITDICSTIANNSTSPAVTYYVRKVTNAYSYNWTVPSGATIISGQGDTAINISFNSSFVSGNISVVALNACGTSSSARILAVYKRTASTPAAIQKQFTPSSIAAVTNVCGLTSETYRITKVTYATSYNWALKIGTNATITHVNASGVNDTAVIVTFLSGFSNDTLSVASVTPCSTSAAKTINLSSVLAPPAVATLTASGNNFSPCIGDIVSYTATASTPTTLQSNISVYRWTRPSFTTIISATVDSATISLKYNTGFVGGNISVKGQSACGIAGNSISTTLQYLPPTPTSITSSTGLYNACIGNQITYTVYVPAPTASQRVASVYRWTKPNYTTIVSAATDSSSIVLKFNSGYVGGSLTVKGQTICGVQGTAKSQALTHTACPTGTKMNPYTLNNTEIISKSDFSVFPNPSAAFFNVLSIGDKNNENIEIRILDLQGRLIEKSNFNSNDPISVGQNLKPGFYMVELKKGKFKQSVKVVKY